MPALTQTFHDHVHLGLRETHAIRRIQAPQLLCHISQSGFLFSAGIREAYWRILSYASLPSDIERQHSKHIVHGRTWLYAYM